MHLTVAIGWLVGPVWLATPAPPSAPLHSDLTAPPKPAASSSDFSAGLEALDGRVLVELACEGVPPSDGELANYGATVQTRGRTMLDVWVPADRVVALVSELASVRSAQPPRRPWQSLGSATTQGVLLIHAEQVHCADVLGAGVAVANLDTSFGGFTDSQARGEMGPVANVPPTTGNAHGTATSEIIFDIAPEVTLHPVAVNSLAELEAFADSASGLGLQVVSHSLVWPAMSFGDDTGPVCDAVEQIVSQGAMFVTSAGNHGDRAFYSATFTDVDGDGVHEFGPGDEMNTLVVQIRGTVNVVLDWDAYPTTDIDYDLHLNRWDGAAWQPFQSSTLVQNGSATPVEELTIADVDPGQYAVVITSNQTPADLVALRVFVGVLGSPDLQYSRSEGALMDPASCSAAMTVGGVAPFDWSPAAIYGESSLGPTLDGRVKPDLIAPTGVATSVWDPFWGTSAAAPHAAGALALYLGAGAATPDRARDWLFADARPEGDPVPNNVFGYGMLRIAPTRVGACTPGLQQTCVTDCGSSGEQTCGTGCVWDACVAPAEVCNGEDDDCDGTADNSFACAAGEQSACTTDCGAQGTMTCAADCEPGACEPGVEQCNNGIDDNCDGQIDEVDAGCAPEGTPSGCGAAPGAWWVLALVFLPRRRRFASSMARG